MLKKQARLSTMILYGKKRRLSFLRRGISSPKLAGDGHRLYCFVSHLTAATFTWTAPSIRSPAKPAPWRVEIVMSTPMATNLLQTREQTNRQSDRHTHDSLWCSVKRRCNFNFKFHTSMTTPAKGSLIGRDRQREHGVLGNIR